MPSSKSAQDPKGLWVKAMAGQGAKESPPSIMIINRASKLQNYHFCPITSKVAYLITSVYHAQEYIEHIVVIIYYGVYKALPF